MTVTHIDGRGRYVELAYEACATGWAHCPHGEHAAAVYRVRPDGRRLIDLTECVDRRTLTPCEAPR